MKLYNFHERYRSVNRQPTISEYKDTLSYILHLENDRKVWFPSDEHDQISRTLSLVLKIEGIMTAFDVTGQFIMSRWQQPRVDNDKLPKQYDVFISYASEDRDAIATPLAESLKRVGIKVWYDQFALKWGSHLMKEIDDGLRNSKYGVVILSRAFFNKPWPQRELAALFSMMIPSNYEILLPLLHKITHKDIVKEIPLLSDILTRSSDEDIDF